MLVSLGRPPPRPRRRVLRAPRRRGRRDGLLRLGREPDDAVPRRSSGSRSRSTSSCALDTHRKASLEAGLKYLIVGSFGSAILLFGSALIYGATGELGFNAIRDATGADDPLFVAGMAMIIAGLAFKASAAPFHMWTPDVYEGAPTP